MASTGGELLVDGSYGEGGGQILRTALALATLMQKTVRISNIRANRKDPGLRPQHLASIEAITSLCDAETENLVIGSSEVVYRPGTLRHKSLQIDVGTAGSITLILQLLVPTVSLGGLDLDLKITGGTDVRWSPTIDYFRHVVLPAYRRVGVDANVSVIQRGFYPKGGGKVTVSIKRASEVRPVALLKREESGVGIISSCSLLPSHVAERQLRSAATYLSRNGIEVSQQHVEVNHSLSPGSSITVFSVGQDGMFIGGDAIGAPGKPAEAVGRRAAEIFVEAYESGAPLDSHVGDMIIMPLALARGESTFWVSRASEHLRTNLYVARLISSLEYDVSNRVNGSAIVRLARHV